MTHLERKSNPFLVADKKKQWKEQRGKAKKQAVSFNALEDDKHLNLPPIEGNMGITSDQSSTRNQPQEKLI